MTDTTPRHQLPYILPSQAQKHVTHNEALRLLDALVQSCVLGIRSDPPENPQEGDCHIVGPEPTGAWSRRPGYYAQFVDGSWQLLPPLRGWLAWDVSRSDLLLHDGRDWLAMGLPRQEEPIVLLGINTSADAQNRLAVASPGTLLTHEGAGHRLTLNKAEPANTGSLLFQTGWSGRAEIGLTGDDRLHVKVSPDGSAWKEAMVVDPQTGAVSFPYSNFTDDGDGGAGGGTPMAAAGDEGQLQFNQSGLLGATPALRYAAGAAALQVAGSLRLGRLTGSMEAGWNFAETCALQVIGDQNVFLGANAGNASTTGSNNAALGRDAMANLLTGSQNAAMGSGALRSIGSGSNNCGMGANALGNCSGSFNVAVGSFAARGGEANAASTWNVAIGSYALQGITFATLNIAIGSYAGRSLTSGSFNTLIGTNAALGLSTGSQNTVIGSGMPVEADLSNTLILNSGGTERLRCDGDAARWSVPVRLAAVTQDSLPDPAAAGEGALVYVRDAAGGGRPAFSDGTDWRDLADRRILSG